MYYTPIYWLSIVFICLTTKIGKCPLFWVFSIRLQLLYVSLAEYFSKNILVSKSFAKKFGLWNIKKDSFASFFFVWSILNSQWAFYANGPHTKRILQQGGKFIAGVPFNFLLKNSSVCYFGNFQRKDVPIHGIFEQWIRIYTLYNHCIMILVKNVLERKVCT